MAYILFPGRHHLLTNFQQAYLAKLATEGLRHQEGVDGKPLGINEPVDEIIFAVTSANHSNTRRNPLPLYQRAMAIQEFSSTLPAKVTVYDIDDIGTNDNFADYTIKRIANRSDGRLKLTPANTVVACSTPVLKMYEKLGFKILPVELESKHLNKFKDMLPWEIVEAVASLDDNWQSSESFKQRTHPASKRLWANYNIGDKVRMLFKDTLIGDDGDLTQTRDYNTYVRSMDLTAEQKYEETGKYVKPGRIGDIGCAVGSWLKLACKDPRLAESDFYGVEVARKLYDICEQRKNNGDFASDYVFFIKKNAVTETVFEPDSMDTILTSSITHEIESYAGREDLLKFIRNRHTELAENGRWINRDVVGPDHGNEIVYMKLNVADGRNEDWEKDIAERSDLREYLNGLSTYARFLRFAKDFRKAEGYTLHYQIIDIEGEKYIELKLKDASDFMTKKDYTDNWQSEMHETFCFWNFKEWKKALCDAGFKIGKESRSYTNAWIVENRLRGKVSLYKRTEFELALIDYPATNMIVIGEKTLA